MIKKKGSLVFLFFIFLLIGVFSASAQPAGGVGGQFTTSTDPDTQIQVDTPPSDIPVIVDLSIIPCSQLTETGCNQQLSRCKIETSPSNGQKYCTPLTNSPAVESQSNVEVVTTSTINSPTSLTATLSGNNVVLNWNAATVSTTSAPAGAAVLNNQITGNAGFIDSIANFFRGIFGIGTRGAILTQNDLVYDVYRNEGTGSYGVPIRQGITCPPNLPRCSYTDSTAQAGKTYNYKIGVRASSDSYSRDRFSNEVSVSVPAVQAAQTTPAAQKACSELTVAECNTQYTRCNLFTNPSNGQQSCTDLSTAVQAAPEETTTDV